MNLTVSMHITMDSSIIDALVLVAEKAANIARICRQDHHLLSLLVQEKKESEKNPRFVQDFKTFADVLVQEVVKYELGKKFPILSGHIYGEENNEFRVGEENVIVQIKDDKTETEALLFKVLGDSTAAALLANEVYRSLDCDVMAYNLKLLFPQKLGIWIDPIDSTAEYIAGGNKPLNHGLFSGLPCVTVLIGVFDIDTGIPILGVINQPFCYEMDRMWHSRVVYGISLDGYCSSGPKYYPECSEKIVAVSSSEDVRIKKALSDNGYTTVEVAGAGYKLLSIITGEICAYVLSKPSTYYWDTCAPHAILRSIGGGMVDLSTRLPVRYKPGCGTKECCNKGGILAFRNNIIKDDILKILNTS